MLFAYLTLDCIATELIILILFFFLWNGGNSKCFIALSLGFLFASNFWLAVWKQRLFQSREKACLKSYFFNEVCKWHIHTITVTVHWLIDWLIACKQVQGLQCNFPLNISEWPHIILTQLTMTMQFCILIYSKLYQSYQFLLSSHFLLLPEIHCSKYLS